MCVCVCSLVMYVAPSMAIRGFQFEQKSKTFGQTCALVVDSGVCVCVCVCVYVCVCIVCVCVL